MFISSEKDKIKEEDEKLFDGIRTRIKESKVKSAASIDSLLKPICQWLSAQHI
jgi:hypothetical protein